MKKILNIVLIALAVGGVYYVWRKFANGGAASTAPGDLRTTGTAGDGFLNFYPGWRAVPTPSAPNSQSQIPGLITAASTAFTGLIKQVGNIFSSGGAKVPSATGATPAASAGVPSSPDDSNFYNPGVNDWAAPSYNTDFSGPDYNFDSSTSDWLYA